VGGTLKVVNNISFWSVSVKHDRYLIWNCNQTRTNFLKKSWDFRFSRRRVWRWEPSDIPPPWWWRQYARLKRRSTPRLQGPISQEALIFILKNCLLLNILFTYSFSNSVCVSERRASNDSTQEEVGVTLCVTLSWHSAGGSEGNQPQGSCQETLLLARPMVSQISMSTRWHFDV
jgi:hypothetical protein